MKIAESFGENIVVSPLSLHRVGHCLELAQRYLLISVLMRNMMVTMVSSNDTHIVTSLEYSLGLIRVHISDILR